MSEEKEKGRNTRTVNATSSILIRFKEEHQLNKHQVEKI